MNVLNLIGDDTSLSMKAVIKATILHRQPLLTDNTSNVKSDALLDDFKLKPLLVAI